MFDRCVFKDRKGIAINADAMGHQDNGIDFGLKHVAGKIIVNLAQNRICMCEMFGTRIGRTRINKCRHPSHFMGDVNHRAGIKSAPDQQNMGFRADRCDQPVTIGPLFNMGGLLCGVVSGDIAGFKIPGDVADFLEIKATFAVG